MRKLLAMSAMLFACKNASRTTPPGDASTAPQTGATDARAEAPDAANGALGSAADGGADSDPSFVSMGPPTITVPIEAVDATLAEMTPKLRRCYEKGLQDDPKQAAKGSFVLRVNSTGDVARAILWPTGSLSSTTLSCVQRVGTQTVFKPPEGGSPSTITVQLTLGNQAP